jgi:putative ABC transport system ATP-binding protein
MSKQRTASIKVENLNKSFDIVGGQIHVLKDLSFEIYEGEFAVIYGPSGCGKSTLLHTILGLEKPNSGSVSVLGQEIYNGGDEDSISDFRKHNLGMVYQQANWVKAVNVEENVALPLALLGQTYAERMPKARAMLDSIKLLDWALYHPSELSSGQQQRVSLARAFITDPKIIIADEPTGNLDFVSGEELISMLKEFCNQQGKTVVMVTHDLEYLKYADKAVRLFDGEVQKIFSPKVDIAEMKDINKRREMYEKLTK